MLNVMKANLPQMLLKKCFSPSLIIAYKLPLRLLECKALEDFIMNTREIIINS